MNQPTRISTAQLVSLMTVSSVTLIIACNASLLGGNDLTDNLLSCAIAFVGNFLLALPVFFLLRARPNSGLLLDAQRVGKWLLYCAAIFYILYFLWIDLQYLSMFQFFLSNVFRPVTPAWIFTVMIVLAAVYSAFKGLDAMGRAAAVILTTVLLGLSLIAVLLLSDVKPDNFTPLLYHGPTQMLSGTAFYLSGGSCIALYALLFPTASGNRNLGFCIWNLLTYAVAGAILALIVGVLGTYANLQLFPFYSAATMANLGTFQRMDSVFICIWIIGLFLKLAIDLHTLSLCANAILPKKVRAFTIPLFGLFICAGTIFIVNNRTLLNLFLNPLLTAPFTIAAAALFPLLSLIGNLIKDRRRKRHG